MKSFELNATTQKSYYRKAFVYTDDAGNAVLKSYETVVCGIIDGTFYKFWDDYSLTTMHHINDFCRLYDVPTMNKKAWMTLNRAEALSFGSNVWHFF